MCNAPLIFICINTNIVIALKFISILKVCSYFYSLDTRLYSQFEIVFLSVEKKLFCDIALNTCE